MLNYSAAWQFSRGQGQKVAVIDTGVARVPRLHGLEPGGDYVSSSDGLVDCDAHGTLVAGLIAAAPSPDDAFAGVAPDATILSIRQNSGAYSTAGTDTQPVAGAVSTGYGNTVTLAWAIVRAVDLGATVINLSELACVPAGTPIDDTDLGRAVRYAFERNVVVVAAAGSVDPQGLCKSQNEIGDPNLPLTDAWQSVQTIASPAWFDEYVLTVGAVTADGQPSDFSLHGPWLDVAAPGENMVSLDPNTSGLMNAWLDPRRGPLPVSGTSFATPLVSGLVALVRSRFPDLSAAQVIDRIKRTAHRSQAGPDIAVGYGVIDPVAALTNQLPAPETLPDVAVGRPMSLPKQLPHGSQQAQRLAIASTVAAALLAAIATVSSKRRPRRLDEGDTQ